MGKEAEDNKNLSEKNYGSYLKVSREALGITPEQLAKGLCVKSMISDIENGNKRAGWLLQERLLRRSGVASEVYESYSGYGDFTEWERQEEILDFLEALDIGQLGAALDKYAERYGLEKAVFGFSASPQSAYGTSGNVIRRLRRQFYLGMLGMCRKLAGAAREELEVLFGAAVRQSVSEIDCKPLRGLVLCAEEINLILEYIQCLPANEAQRKCRELKKYLEDAPMEDDTRVLNYPKVLFVLCQLLQEQAGTAIRECAEVIRLCDLGIELIRKTSRAYYLFELLETKKNMIEQIIETNCRKGEAQRNEALRGMLDETDGWIALFGDLYEQFEVEKNQTSDVYLYRGQDTYYAGDMIRARRKMLGMTQKELYESVGCTPDTLQDLEGKKHSTQPFYLQEMCKRLGLSPVCERTELMTADPKAREMEKIIRYAANDRKFMENLEQIEKLKNMIDMSEPINQQWVLRTEGMARHELELMDDAEYEAVVKQAIECTLPMSILEYPDDKECYLTNSEMESIYHYSLLVRHEDVREAYRRMKVVFRLEQEFEEAGKEKNHVRTYELYMKYMASLLCEMNECVLAKQQVEKVIPICLRARRINMLDGLMYVWTRSNTKLQKKATEPIKASYDWKKDLKCCLALSQFCWNNVRKEFYEEVWKQIVGDKS